MQDQSTVRIKITHKATGKPATGYSIFVLEHDFENEEDKMVDADGEIKPFVMDLDNYTYVSIFVNDENGDNIIAADNDYILIKPETLIDIEV